MPAPTRLWIVAILAVLLAGCSPAGPVPGASEVPQASYRPYGKQQAATGTALGAIGYQGQWTADTGLVHMGA